MHNFCVFVTKTYGTNSHLRSGARKHIHQAIVWPRKMQVVRCAHLFCQMANFSARTSWDNGNLLMFDVSFLAVKVVIASAASFFPRRAGAQCLEKCSSAKCMEAENKWGTSEIVPTTNSPNKFCHETKVMLIINKHDWNAVSVPPNLLRPFPCRHFLLLSACKKNNMQ